MDLQNYFDNTFSKESQVIRIEEIKEELEGDKLTIEDFSDLESLFAKELPKLKTLTIKNCEKLKNLELELNQEVEINLVGNFPLLKNWKVKQTPSHPIYIKQSLDSNSKGNGNSNWFYLCCGFLILVGLIAIMIFKYFVRIDRNSIKLGQTDKIHENKIKSLEDKNGHEQKQINELQTKIIDLQARIIHCEEKNKKKLKEEDEKEVN